jgi:putative two-component system response regulator
LLKPERLTNEEFEIIKSHASIGIEILGKSRFSILQAAREIAGSHHERWDGTGYPEGLQGHEIPLSGRIVAIADVFDALTHDRPYKKAWSLEEAVTEIERLSGLDFDPHLIEVFLALDRNEGIRNLAASLEAPESEQRSARSALLPVV